MPPHQPGTRLRAFSRPGPKPAKRSAPGKPFTAGLGRVGSKSEYSSRRLTGGKVKSYRTPRFSVSRRLKRQSSCA